MAFQSIVPFGSSHQFIVFKSLPSIFPFSSFIAHLSRLSSFSAIMSQTQTITAAPADASKLPNLYVNHDQLDTSNVGLLQPTYPQTTSLEEMRRRLSEDGYLFVKGILPREDVLEARKKYFEALACTGLLKPGTQPVEGIFDSAKDSADYPGIGTGGKGTGKAQSDKFLELAHKAHGEEWYAETFCKHPALIDFLKKLSGWGENMWNLERTILRNNVPGNKAVGVHYDLIFLRHGNDSVMTAWVPMGDVKVEGGGLIYLEQGEFLHS